MSDGAGQAGEQDPRATSTSEAEPVILCDGQSLSRAMAAACQWLRGHAAIVNSLNVFPVPDGDTGTNMSLTMTAALAEVERSSGYSAAAVARALAHGGLMGARGNSGVILSQILRGFAHGLDGQGAFSAHDLVRAAWEGYETAVHGVIKPVEGTILTVMRATAKSIEESTGRTNDLLVILAQAVEDARETTRRTPEMLPVLKEAGVVDAGGQGLVYLLEGALRYARGEAVDVDAADTDLAVSLRSMVDPGADGFGWDVQFFIKGDALDVSAIRRDLAAMGESVLVVGDANMVKVHIHVPDPEVPISYGQSKGTVVGETKENMQEQYQRFVMEQARPTPEDGAGIAVVCVASGDGLAHIIELEGASKIIPGGQTMNPSTQQILAAINSVRANQVLVLPNNANVIPAAEQARKLSSKQVIVVPARSIPQGIAALLGFNAQADLKRNVEQMMRHVAEVQTIEITHAVRSTRVNGMKVEHGDVIGLLDEKLVATGRDDANVTLRVLELASAGEREIATIYFGQDVTAQEAAALAEYIREASPDLKVEVYDGGQSYYRYIISLE